MAVSDDSAPASPVVDDIQLEFDMTPISGAWTFVPQTLETAQVGLDAVRYQSNYVRTVTTRLCLHYINTIRKRVSSASITSYLFSVDGCELSQVEPTGRCDIYYCRPYTYELQLAQKAAGSDVFIVQSIYKTVDQKSLDILREDSNLEFSTAPEIVEAAGVASLFNLEEAPAQTELPQAAGDKGHKRPTGDEQPIAWTTDVWPVEVTTTQPLSLRTESLSMSASRSEKTPTVDSATVIAIIGIAMVSVSSIAFVVAIVMVRWRDRENTPKHTLDEEHSPLGGRLNTTESTISTTSTDSITTDTKPAFEKIAGFLI